jgi:hypothetical protein
MPVGGAEAVARDANDGGAECVKVDMGTYDLLLLRASERWRRFGPHEAC